MFEDLKVVNASGGISAYNPASGANIYAAPGTPMHDLLSSGVCGAIAEYVAPPDPAEAPAFPSASSALAALAEAMQGQIAAFSSGVPAGELAGWSDKADAARAVIDGTATEGQEALIEAEAAITGETAAELAAAVVARAQMFLQVLAAAAGVRRKYRALIDAVTDPYVYEELVPEAASELAGLIAGLGEAADG